MKKSFVTTTLFFLMAVLLLAAAGRSLASPVPVLQSERESVWESAWETAWQLAWETTDEFTLEFSGDVQGNTPLEMTLELTGQEWLEALDLAWGLSVSSLSAGSAGGAQPSLVASFGLPWADEHAFHEDIRIGKLFLKTTPATASVRLLNSDKQFSQGMALAPGQYVLEVSEPGYEPQVRRVEVIDDMAATVRMELVRNSGPESSEDSMVSEEAATNEQLVKNLATPGYEPPVASRQEPRSRSTTATPVVEAKLGIDDVLQQPVPAGHGTLLVTTEPSGARVRVLSIEPRYRPGMALEPGVYVIDAQLFGYKTIRREVEVRPGEEAALHLAMEEAAPGRLFVRTRPEGAYVRVLNIEPRFQQGMELPGGSYVVDAHVSGYEPKTLKVQVLPGQDNVLEMDLEQALPTGRLYVDTQPGDATVRVLGILPVFHQGIELAEGTYTIDATIDNSNTVKATVEVKAGKDNRVSVQLPPSRSTGKLFVKAEPVDATIRVMDVWPVFEQGMTLEEGTYTLEVSAEGHNTIVRRITVLPDRDTTVSLALEDPSKAAFTPVPVILDPAPTAPPVSLTQEADELVLEQSASLEAVETSAIEPVFGIEIEPVAEQASASVAEPIAEPVAEPVAESAILSPVQEHAPSEKVLGASAGDPLGGEGVPASEAAMLDDSDDIEVPILSNDIPDRDSIQVPQVAIAPEDDTYQSLPPVEEIADDLVFSEETSEVNIHAFDIEMFLSMANLAINAGDYLGALKSARQVISLDEENIQAYQLMGKAYMNLAKYEDALQTVNQALVLSPQSKGLRQLRQEIVQNARLRDSNTPEEGQAINLDPGYYDTKQN